MINPTAMEYDRAPGYALTDPVGALQQARERLKTNISNILTREATNPASSPDWLAFQLAVVYQEASTVWNAVRGTRGYVHAEVRGSGLWLSQGSGSLELVWRRGRGWTSVLLGLHGDFLADCLAAWPAFHVPDEEPGSLNVALAELRRLCGQPDTDTAVQVAEILDVHVHPVVQEYARHHLESWPLALRRAFEGHQNRRFAHHSLMLLKAQNRQELRALLDSTNPGEEPRLSRLLARWFEEACPIWGRLLDRTIALNTGTRARGAQVWVRTQLGLDGVTLVWSPVGWVPSDAPGRDAVDALMHLLTEVEYSHEDDLYTAQNALTFEEEEALLRERLEDYCRTHQPDVLREAGLRDVGLEEEHWMVGQYVRGMQFGVDAQVHLDYITEE